MHAHHQRSKSKERRKCSIIPIISILCVIVSSINIFLIANIFLLEKNTMVGMPNNGAHDIQLLYQHLSILVDHIKEKEYVQQTITRRTTATTFNP